MEPTCLKIIYIRVCVFDTCGFHIHKILFVSKLLVFVLMRISYIGLATNPVKTLSLPVHLLSFKKGPGH